MKKILSIPLTAFIAVSLAAQAPIHLELNSVTGVYEKGEKVEVYASLTEAQLTEGVLIKRGKKSFAKFILV